jgi:hypothetical protein
MKLPPLIFPQREATKTNGKAMNMNMRNSRKA